MHLTYRNRRWHTKWSQYTSNNANALILVADDDGTMIKASTNVDEINGPAVLAVKNWSENAGMAKALADAEIIEPEASYFIPSGRVNVPVYYLTAKGREDLLTQRAVGIRA